MTLKEIDVDELAQWRNESRAFVLLDVREPDEVAAASIPGAVHIPMRDIPQRFAELPSDATIAVLCHHGGRSERVANFLLLQGFSDVCNVNGGIDAYARQIDPAIPLY
ncbi:MAG: rhodanese-like domain-containing protein [Candidatus Eremiobacteraeota bacterium]|nr:rhodanese-like domain-containing protein [Candidatus Eremiobacteraeota bacterium]